MATTLYLVVSGRGTRDEIRAYMYATSILFQEEDFDRVEEVCSMWSITCDKSDHAEFLAKYQTGRLESSGRFIASVFDTMADASKWYTVVFQRALDKL